MRYLLTLFLLGALGCNNQSSNGNGQSTRGLNTVGFVSEPSYFNLMQISIPEGLCGQFGMVHQGNHSNTVIGLSNGKYLAFKDCRVPTTPYTTPRLTLIRFNSDFSIDKSYGAQGAIVFDQFDSCWWKFQRSDSNGIFATTGCSNPQGHGFANLERILKLKHNGNIDSSFGENGWVQTNNEHFYLSTYTKVSGNLLVTGYFSSQNKLELIEYRDKSSGSLVSQGNPKVSWSEHYFASKQDPEFRFGREYYRRPPGQSGYWAYTTEIFEPQDPKDLLTGEPQLFPIENALYMRVFKFKDHLLVLEKSRSSQNRKWTVSKFVYDSEGHIIPMENFGTEKKSYDFFRSEEVIAKHYLTEQDIVSKEIGIKTLDFNPQNPRGFCLISNRTEQRITFACHESNNGYLHNMTLVALNSEGDLDSTFGINGIINVPDKTIEKCRGQLQHIYHMQDAEIYGCQQTDVLEEDVFIYFILK